MRDRKIHGESNVCSTGQGHKKIYSLLFMLGLKETMDQ